MTFQPTSGAWWARLSAIALIVAMAVAAPPAGAQISFSNVSTAAGITTKSVSYGASWVT